MLIFGDIWNYARRTYRNMYNRCRTCRKDVENMCNDHFILIIIDLNLAEFPAGWNTSFIQRCANWRNGKEGCENLVGLFAQAKLGSSNPVRSIRLVISRLFG